MELFCILAGHWPVPFASRRNDDSKRNRCWMCDERIVEADGAWLADPGATAGTELVTLRTSPLRRGHFQSAQ